MPSLMANHEYRVYNVDGPTVDVVVNGQFVRQLPCGTSVELTQLARIPALPWTIELRRVDGRAIGRWSVQRLREARQLVLRGEEAHELPIPASIGPPPRLPCPG
jgi:hypothetical protein